MANDSAPGPLIPSHPHNQALPSGARHPSDSRWQRRLLPYLVGTLGFLTLLFCAAIAWETHYIQGRMESALQLDLRPAIDQQFRADGPFLLEANLMERRYRAADAAALSRIYLMFLGFGTGMVLALVGATFVLGKISESETSIDGGGSAFKASMHSGSPGMILAFFGTVLMLSTIFSKTEISISDRAIYMGTGLGATAAPEADAPAATPQDAKKSDPARPDARPMLASAAKPASAAPPILEAKNERQPPDVHLVMASRPTVDGDFALTLASGPGTLSIGHGAVHFAGSDGQKRQVKVLAIDATHVAFRVLEPGGGTQDFDGFVTSQNDIVGSTSYKGSSSSTVFGFTATRIKQN